MTNHPTFPTHDTASENIVPFPNTSDASLPSEHLAIDGHGPDGIPEGFALHHDGIHELRPGDGDDLVPVKICSPIVVKGRCRNAIGHGWGRVLDVQDPDGNWHELVFNGQQLNKSANAALVPLFDLGFELAPISKAAESVRLLLLSWQPDTRYAMAEAFPAIGYTFPVTDRGGRPVEADIFVLGGDKPRDPLLDQLFEFVVSHGQQSARFV